MTRSRITVPVVDPRDAATIAAEAAACMSAFVPGARVTDSGPAAAVTQIFGRFVKALADRVNQAPTKNQLAFYDMLGVGLLPAQAARAPFVFSALPNVGDSRVPVGTRIGARVAGIAEPLVFETEQALGLAAAKLVEVRTIWPGRDAAADHSAALAAGDEFTLFEPLSSVVHALYLAHDVNFALAGRSVVEVRFDLTTPAGVPLATAWEYWDGDLWRPFREFAVPATAADTDSVDATSGFTRSGVIRLVADCATSKPTTVAGIDARWLRARLVEPLNSGVTMDLPEVDRIVVRTVVDRTLPFGSCAALPEGAGIIADQAYAGETKLDLTKASQPMGIRPVAGSAFLLACDEAFKRPGAEVTLCFHRLQTAEEQADQQGADLALDINASQKMVVDAATAATNALLQLETGIRQFADLSPADDALMNAAHTGVVVALGGLTAQGINGIAALDDAARNLLQRLDLATSDTLNNPDLLALGLLPPFAINQLLILGMFGAYAGDVRPRVQQAGARMHSSAHRDEDVLNSLKQLTPFSAAMAAGASLPTMATRWLPGNTGTAVAGNRSPWLAPRWPALSAPTGRSRSPFPTTWSQSS